MGEWTGIAGKQVLITGATNGIGLAGAIELARRGAKLALVARSPEKGRAVAAEIEAAASGDHPVDVLHADLAAQASVRELAVEVLGRYPRLDVLVNNAGALYATRELSPDGIELTWAVNHLAPFLLTTLLLDRLKESAPARVITTSSDAHKGTHIPFSDLDASRSYRARGFGRYGQTKLANILFTTELARRLQGTEVSANCFHPGVVASGFNRNNGPVTSLLMSAIRPFSRTPEKGAETLVWLADSAEVDGESGGYYVNCKLGKPTAAARDADSAARLWEVSEEQIKAPASSAS